MAILKHKEDVLGAAQQARTSTSESPAAVHTLERSQKRLVLTLDLSQKYFLLVDYVVDVGMKECSL